LDVLVDSLALVPSAEDDVVCSLALQLFDVRILKHLKSEPRRDVVLHPETPPRRDAAGVGGGGADQRIRHADRSLRHVRRQIMTGTFSRNVNPRTWDTDGSYALR